MSARVPIIQSWLASEKTTIYGIGSQSAVWSKKLGSEPLLVRLVKIT